MTMNRSLTRVAEPARHPHRHAWPSAERTTPWSRGAPEQVAYEPPHQNVFTPEELALISLFADGLCIEAIARQLELSDRTIRRRSRAMCDRLGVVSTIQVVAWAARRQLI